MVHFLINGILDSVIYSVGDVNVIQSGKFDNISYVMLDKLKLTVSPIASSVILKKFITNIPLKMQFTANHMSFCKTHSWLQIFRLHL